MVKPIDRFIGALHREKGDEIVLDTGKPGRMRIGTQEKVILAQEVRLDQLDVLLRDIVPDEYQPRLRGEGEISFPYLAPTGPVLVRFRRGQDRATLSIYPHKGQLSSSEQAQLRIPPQRTETSTTGYPPPSAAPPPRESRPTSSAKEHAPPPNPSYSPPANPAAESEDDGWAISLDLGPALLPSTASGANGAPAVPRSDGKMNAMLEAMWKARCSDLHLTPGLSPRARRAGALGPLPGYEYPVDAQTIEGWLMSIAPPAARERFTATHDAHYAYSLPGIARFRVNMFRDRRGPCAVLRAIPEEPLTVEQLRLPQTVADLAMLERGLVIVAGTKSSGKSTTLAAIVELMNRVRAVHLVTIEDPVEFTHQERCAMIHQREVHVDTESFEAGLRAAIRQAPDAILVGDMRTEEATFLALEAASSGILVLTALHADTAVGAIDRIIDQFPVERQALVRLMLSATLKCVIVQTLCRYIKGGQIAALEVLPTAPSIAALIREAKTSQIPSAMAAGRSAGMQTLNDVLAQMVGYGVITVEEALARSPAISELRTLMERTHTSAR